MNQLPKRKPNRIPEFDYSTPGAYFLTICTQKREPILWSSGRGDLRSPADICLSDIGNIVDDEIGKMNGIYANVKVDKYCIMPDHIHMIITISEEFPPLATPPNIPRIIQQFKGVVTKRAKRSIWQKTYYDHAIRNQTDYDEVWRYIENNPLKYLLKTRNEW